MKKILSLLLASVMLFANSAGVLASPASNSLGEDEIEERAKEPVIDGLTVYGIEDYLEILDELANSSEYEREDAMTELYDVDGDGKKEMILIDITPVYLYIFVYKYAPGGTNNILDGDFYYSRRRGGGISGVDVITGKKPILRITDYITGGEYGAITEADWKGINYIEFDSNNDTASAFGSKIVTLGQQDGSKMIDGQLVSDGEWNNKKKEIETGEIVNIFTCGNDEWQGKKLPQLQSELKQKLITMVDGVTDITASLTDEEKLEIQNLISLAGTENDNISEYTDEDLVDYLFWTAYFGDDFFGELKTEYGGDMSGTFIRLSDFRTGIDKYFGVDITDIYEYLNIVELNGEKWVNMGEKVDEGTMVYPKIQGVYSLGGEYYYVIFDHISTWCNPYPLEQLITDLDNVETHGIAPYEGSGYVIVKKRPQSAKSRFSFISAGVGLMEASALERYITKDRSPSNITIDYNALADYKDAESYIDYLKNVMGEIVPNDSAKTELVRYIEYAIEKLCVADVKVKGKKITITKEDIQEACNAAKVVQEKFRSVLDERGISLNKALEITVSLAAKGTSLKKGVTVIYDPSLYDVLGDIGSLRVVLDKEGQCVTADSATVMQMMNNNLKVFVQYKDGGYNISFLDENDEVISKISTPLTFTFKINSKYDTVYYHNGDQKENWSGQISEADNTIEFMTALSGFYSVEENEPDISDISGLSQEEQAAIKFMVSRGYFSLEDGKFNPHNSLWRYDFTKALVSIFYARDFSAKSTFSDVAEDSEYYNYVASSQQADIVKGFPNNTFRGEKNTTKEEVISIAARTLADKKEYFYPENTEEYVQFADNEEIAGWENQYGEIALAVREGLIAKGGILAPSSNITRVEAAVILYRLFNALYEIAPVSSQNHSTDIPVAAVAAVGGVVVIGAGSTAFVILRKKRAGVK